MVGINSSSTIPRSFFYNKSSKQKLVATSSTHAEMRSLYELTVTLIFVTHLLQEIGRPAELPIIVFEDNQPVLDLTDELSNGAKRSKHFIMLTNFIKEQVESGLIQLSKVGTKENLANVLTKIVTGQEFQNSFCKIMGTTPHQI